MDLLGINVSQMEDWLQWGGYLILFLALFGCGLGLPYPEDLPIFLAGFFVARARMNLGLAALAAWCGIMAGDLVLYYLGRRFGPSINKVPLVGHHVTPQRLELVERLFDRYGFWVIAVLRLFPGIRGIMVLAAGTIRYNRLKFFLLDGLAAVASGGIFIALGMLAGRYVGQRDIDVFYRQEIKPYEDWLAILGGVALVVLIAYLWWRHRKHKGLTDLVIERAAEDLPPHQDRPQNP